MTTKEEILKLTGEPVAYIRKGKIDDSDCEGIELVSPAGDSGWAWTSLPDGYHELYTDDQILAVVKPLEFERDVQKADIAFLNKQLAEKDAEIERLMEKHNALHINARASRDAVERQAAQLKVAREALDAVQQVANRSDGIAGWHLNGDIASWEFILPEVDQALATISDPNEILAERDARVWEKAADFLDGYHYLSANFAAAQEDMRKEAARIREGVKS